MKKHLFLMSLLIISTFSFTQDKGSNQVLESSFQETQKTKVPPYFSIITMLGGVSAVGGGALKHTSPTLWVILEGNIPVGRNNMYLYTQFRSSFFIGQSLFPFSGVQPIIHMESTKIGFLLGLGFILKDWRNKDYQGWRIAFNSGFVFEYGFNQNIINPGSQFTSQDVTDEFYNIGFEINTRFYYSISKYASLTLGLSAGYLYSPFSGDPLYLGKQKEIVSFHSLYYGINMGFSF